MRSQPITMVTINPPSITPFCNSRAVFQSHTAFGLQETIDKIYMYTRMQW